MNKTIVVLGILMVLSGCSIHPIPITLKQHQQRLSQDQSALQAKQQPLTQPLTLPEAMARAIRYNLNHRISLLHGALSAKELNTARLELLPKLTAQAGYNYRSNLDASSSESIETGTETLEPSTSSDREISEASLSFTWSVLDFGLSYVRAKQQANRYLMAKEHIRKIAHQIMLDVRSAYWRTVAQQRLMKHIDKVMAQAENALRDSEVIRQKRLQSPFTALTYQRDILLIIRELHILRKNVLPAKAELAKLINVLPSSSITVIEPTAHSMWLPDPPMSLGEFEQHALLHRPELINEVYKERITTAETKAAMLQLLPHLKLQTAGYYNSNDFLVNQHWGTIGIDVSYNLLGTFSQLSRLKVAKEKQNIIRLNRLAMHMAVLSQIHIAWQAYYQAIDEFKAASHFSQIEQKIVHHVRVNARKKRLGKNELLRAELNHLLGTLRRDLSYADVHNTFGQLLVASGIDVLPTTITDNTLTGWANGIEQKMLELGDKITSAD
ncbi:TolC family protein [Endozoicomonas sp. SM1973]|uniref:TolC family protein n=1 Tax=Spartinivicinus marinus TaxID=2994442 RepID=A0A853IC30_9GAMM|nr:TolC family protein [Spartinivicinus marinus]MCX4028436.1 TolC family protein [Spartinivicinus marinus]NYZ67451.1 TolC family protein [Spartinivicinus marinus]